MATKDSLLFILGVSLPRVPPSFTTSGHTSMERTASLYHTYPGAVTIPAQTVETGDVLASTASHLASRATCISADVG